MVMDILNSALAFKQMYPNTHCLRLDTLAGSKVLILSEVNMPVLSLAISKAATMLGAYDVTIFDKLQYDFDYYGKVFSQMADIIFVTTKTHACIERFSKKSSVPVLCMHSRTNCTVQSLATVMTIIEEFGTMKDLNIGYIGPSLQILNSYLLLCPMLGANIKYKCGFDMAATPNTPLLKKICEDLCHEKNTTMLECEKRSEVFDSISVLIAGPSTRKVPNTLKKVSLKDMEQACENWIFFHTCPRGSEVEDEIFNHKQSRTFNAFGNFQYIAAALMANAIKGILFQKI